MVPRRPQSQWYHEGHKVNGTTEATKSMVPRRPQSQWYHEGHKVNGTTEATKSMVPRRPQSQWYHGGHKVNGTTEATASAGLDALRWFMSERCLLFFSIVFLPLLDVCKVIRLFYHYLMQPSCIHPRLFGLLYFRKQMNKSERTCDLGTNKAL